MDILRKEEIYTIDDIYALPDGERAELIDGKIYDMAPPGMERFVKCFFELLTEKFSAWRETGAEKGA